MEKGELIWKLVDYTLIVIFLGLLAFYILAPNEIKCPSMKKQYCPCTEGRINIPEELQNIYIEQNINKTFKNPENETNQKPNG